jgi:UDP-glucose 4-epimerase
MCCRVALVVGQVGDRPLLDQLLSGEHPATAADPIQAVLHFAAYAYVGESVADPARYYRNNLGDSLTLLEALPCRGAAPRRPAAAAGVFQHLRQLWLPRSRSNPELPKPVCSGRSIPTGRSKWMGGAADP